MVDTTERLTNLAVDCAVPLLAAANDKAQPLLWRLDPQQQANVLMALLGLALVGAGLVAIVIVGARHLRRVARNRPGPTRSTEDRWYRKPLAPLEPPESSKQNPSAD